MTVFVASLFLPYTVYFDIQAEAPPTKPKAPQRQPSLIRDEQDKQDEEEIERNLFAQALGFRQPVKSPAAAAAASDEHETSSASTQPIVPNLGQGSQHEIHSPAWGRASYFQPESRAISPPPASILKFSRASDRRNSKYKPSWVSENRQDTHDLALSSAEWHVQPADQGNGGLRNAVSSSSLSGSLPDKTWVGTLGMPTDALDEERKSAIQDKLEHDFDCATVFINDSDFDGHYSHYCKTILWPVFHYQIPDNPKSKAYEDHSWIYYVKINQAFADTIIRSWKKGDVVWIHDYHLLLVPGMIRKKLPDAQIGFFLHVAFPSSEVFRCLAMRNDLLNGILGANLVGFQTDEYCHHFLQTCNRLMCVEATAEGIQLEDRFVNVAAFPIGIDPSSLSRRRENPEVLEWIQRLRAKYSTRKLIVARDKLDHVRGVRQKLLAYEFFLNKYPEHKENVVLVQIATSTTEQTELDATVTDIVTRINAMHSTLAHQPLVYLKQDIEDAQFVALMTVADALMITSLREGMNLTSHEFLFVQDGQYGGSKHGSLILSEFTGSSAVFGGNELSVNPWDYHQCAEAVRKVVEMEQAERDGRWEQLMKAVMHHTAEYWFTTFLARLNKVWAEHSVRDTLSIPRLSIHELSDQYRAARKRVFILDYEGTLASFGTATSSAFTSPQRVLDTLNNLLDDRKNIVYVMSGRMPEELDQLFDRVPGLGIIAENGCFLKDFGADSYESIADVDGMAAWKPSVAQILSYYHERTEGSSIEERHCSMLYSYRHAVDPQSAARQAGDCANHINDSCHDLHVHAVPVDGGLVVESTEWSKGTAATRIWERLHARTTSEASSSPLPDFLMVAGDAREDEVIYRWANQLGADGLVRYVTTVSVSSRNTEAKATLTQGVTGVLSALQKLASLS